MSCGSHLACAGRAPLQRAGEAQEGFALLEEAVPSQLIIGGGCEAEEVGMSNGVVIGMDPDKSPQRSKSWTAKKLFLVAAGMAPMSPATRRC